MCGRGVWGLRPACAGRSPQTPRPSEPRMRRSTERILTTHTGSLPRPDDLVRQMQLQMRGVPVDAAAFAARTRAAVAEVVRKQVAAGVDVVNDGEQSKVGFSTYVKERLTGFGGAVAQR